MIRYLYNYTLMRKLFIKSVTTRHEAFDVTFEANEKNQVVATVENSAGQITHKYLGLVDLFGRATKVPAAIHNCLYDNSTPAQQQMLDSFARICVARLKWSTGCLLL